MAALLAGSANGSFHGVLQADGYAGFDRLYEGGRITKAACWAHARRKFFEVQEHQPSPIAAEALERIGALYGIETTLRGKLPAEGCALRQEHTAPLLDELHDWLQATLTQLSSKSELAAAVRYALGRWTALTLHEFHVHQIFGSFLMNGGSNGEQRRYGALSRDGRYRLHRTAP